jgi:hypothetical protein
MRLLIAAAVMATLAGLGEARAMTYRAISVDDGTCGRACPAAIMATGAIEVDEDVRFARFVASADRTRLSRVLVLHSPGGNVAGSIRLGLLTRRLGLNTLVGRVSPAGVAPGVCASACVYLFMAGAERRLVTGSRLVVHAAKSMGITQRDIMGAGTIDAQVAPGAFESAMREYAQTMGVNPALIDLASSVPHESAHILSPSEVSGFRLVTGTAQAGRRAARRRSR